MNENEVLVKGLKKEKRGFSLVWIAPIVAVLITSGMIWKTYITEGTRISIIVNSGDGIKDGKTPIMYKGIKIGIVEDIHIKEDDVSKLELIALIDKEAAEGVTRKGNMFWMVKPTVTLTEVSGLDTIVGGRYIAVMPAANTGEALYALPYQDKFIALDSPPIDVFDPGLSVVVNTVNKGDVSIGAPVFYNKQAIGKVENKKLSEDKLSIDLFLRIKSKYADLVHQETIFYKADAIEVKASLSNVKVNMGSFASFIAGGIGMHNSDEAFDSPLAKNTQSYSLYDNYDEIMLCDDEVVLLMQESHQISAGITKIYYKGVEAGLVKHIDYDPVKNETQIRVRLHKDYRDFANEKAYFWIVKPQLDFDGVKGLDTVLRGNYINFTSSDIKAKRKMDFILYEKKHLAKGVHIKLSTDDIRSIKEGAGVFYRSIEIGAVGSYVLNKDNLSFTIDLIIEPKYANLINGSSGFYYNSGVEFKASLDNVSFSSGSLESVLRGGIAVETPDMTALEKRKEKYLLHASRDEMVREKEMKDKGIHIRLLADTAGSLKVGSPVLYKQIKVGEIVSTLWDSERQKLILNVFVVEEYAKEVHKSSLFYNASGVQTRIGLNGLEIDTESIQTIISGGVAFFTPSSVNVNPVGKYEDFTLFETKQAAMNTYINVELIAKDSGGLKRGSTLKYKNVVIGQVENIDLLDEEVKITLQVKGQHKELLNKGSVFWLEGFDLGLNGLKNSSSVITGPSIHIKPGVSKEAEVHFTLMSKPPVPHFQQKGLRVILKAQRLGNIKENTPVYYRQIKIGSAVQYNLSEDARSVDIEIFIEPCYAHLVRKNSYFFNASGIGMKVNLFGAKLKTETLESILTGGIGLLTPDTYTDEARNHDTFRLKESFEEDDLHWSPQLCSTNESCQKSAED